MATSWKSVCKPLVHGKLRSNAPRLLLRCYKWSSAIMTISYELTHLIACLFSTKRTLKSIRIFSSINKCTYYKGVYFFVQSRNALFPKSLVRFRMLYPVLNRTSINYHYNIALTKLYPAPLCFTRWMTGCYVNYGNGHGARTDVWLPWDVIAIQIWQLWYNGIGIYVTW